MKQFCCTLLFFLATLTSYAQNFADFFQDKTLRVDYIFTGDANRQAIYLDELSQLPSWAGRQHHLSELPLAGNGQIIVKDVATGQCIYKTSFSSLFQEWLSTDEARTTAKGFENTFLLPFPKKTVEVEITLYSPRKDVMANFKHIVSPEDILIHKRGTSHVTPHRYMLQSGSEKDCNDVAILAEGYTEKEMDVFYQDAQRTVLPLQRGAGRGDRSLPADFLGVIVAHGVALAHLAPAVGNPGQVEHGLRQGGLSRPAVTGYRQVDDIFGLILVHKA